MKQDRFALSVLIILGAMAVILVFLLRFTPTTDPVVSVGESITNTVYTPYDSNLPTLSYVFMEKTVSKMIDLEIVKEPDGKNFLINYHFMFRDPDGDGDWDAALIRDPGAVAQLKEKEAYHGAR